MLALLMLRNGISFLIAWELMAVSSFMLILLDAEKRATLKTAVNYLVQMHVGLVLLIIAFLICEEATGKMSFDALKIYFNNHSNIGLFILFFLGFAIKAGFIPLHTWLPEAHPAAPSHVSGFMSGVMIKMGIYGIFRVLTYVQHDVYTIGLIIFLISSVTGLLGIMMSIVQNDIKRMLAYCSIENIGIIGTGMGLAVMGWGSHNLPMMMFGFAGALLHIMNHSLIKSLLFFTSGSVYMRYHTKNMDELGGVIHKMPHTAGLFLIGSMAICGLPPFNAFISELLIYSGLFTGLTDGHPFQSIAMLFGILSLALTGGLAIYSFTQAFGITFLGTPRLPEKEKIFEAGPAILFPQYIIAFMIVLIGLFPLIFLRPVIDVIQSSFRIEIIPEISVYTKMLTRISMLSGILILVIVLILILRKVITAKNIVTSGPTWGCGYNAGSAKQQYTATSFSSSFENLASPLIPSKKEFEPVKPEEIFPEKRVFLSQTVDFIRISLYRILDASMWTLKKLARLQTGHIQHYILYAFIFIMIIFLLLYMNVL